MTRRSRRGPGFGQKTDLGAAVSQRQYVAVFQNRFPDLFAVYERSVGAVIDELETVTLANDLGMVAGNNGQIGRETNAAFREASNANDRIGGFFDLALQRALDMDELNDNDGFFRHGHRYQFPKGLGNVRGSIQLKTIAYGMARVSSKFEAIYAHDEK